MINQTHMRLVLIGLECVALILAVPMVSAGETVTHGANRSDHRASTWRIEPSLKFDALCLINALTGDHYYLAFYREAYSKYETKMTSGVREALARLKKSIKDDGGGIISARLCLFFSSAEDETLDDMLATVRDPMPLRRRFSTTPYWNEESWRQFESILPDLATVLQWYKDIEFEQNWKMHARPRATAKAAELLSKVEDYDILPLVESYLGRPIASETVTIYMLNYSQPHGIKITGTRFLTDVAWPFEIVLRNAVHEMMHPPYRLEGDPELRAVIETLGKDEFLTDKVENHNPSFGYNTLEGFVEEDCVQALDQLINERLGIAQDAAARWSHSDDGIHVLAVALYQLMKTEQYPSQDETFRDFLVRMNSEGRLAPGRIRSLHLKMFPEGK